VPIARPFPARCCNGASLVFRESYDGMNCIDNGEKQFVGNANNTRRKPALRRGAFLQWMGLLQPDYSPPACAGWRCARMAALSGANARFPRLRARGRGGVNWARSGAGVVSSWSTRSAEAAQYQASRRTVGIVQSHFCKQRRCFGHCRRHCRDRTAGSSLEKSSGFHIILVIGVGSGLSVLGKSRRAPARH
jgi:hypothetical protein